MFTKITNIGQLATYNSHTSSVEKRSNVDIIVGDGQFTEIGERLPAGDEEIDAHDRLVTPGFVDSHTHPIFVDTREKEFEMRVAGKSYREIVAAGGGIRTSVEALRPAEHETLCRLVTDRMRQFLRLGTTTIEGKSGYGLSTESELKSLAVIQKVAKSSEIDIVPTFLGAHDFPEEYSEEKDGYIDLLCDEMIPAVAEQGVARFCDVFCENGWFDVDQSRRILRCAMDHGMDIRLHADEFEDSGGARLAAELKAASADHLMAISDEGISRLAEAGVVSTLLPATTFFLAETTYAPARKLLDAGVEVALATDFNPGSSMTQSMPLVMTLACLYLRMTIEEAFAAATYVAAKSLRIENKVGTVEAGKQADLVIWELTDLSQIPYWFGGNQVSRVMKHGTTVWMRDECSTV